MTTTTFTNPLTDVSYRLVVTDDTWRITRSRMTTSGVLRLAHLRARIGTAPIAPALVAQIVKGESCRTEEALDGERAFSAVVVADLDETVNYLAALAANATHVLEAGRPGFRAASPVLRQRRDAARQEAEEGARKLRAAWAASGLVADDVPDWIRFVIAGPLPPDRRF